MANNNYSYLYSEPYNVPNALTKRIVVDKQKITVDFHLKLITNQANGLSYYFNNLNKYKIAVFVSEVYHRDETFNEPLKLFISARDEKAGVKLSKILPLSAAKKLYDVPTQNQIKFIKKNALQHSNGYGMVDFQQSQIVKINKFLYSIPYSVTIDVPDSFHERAKNLSIFIVPYLDSSIGVTAHGSGNNILSIPVLAGDFINERIYNNDRIVSTRSYYRQIDDGSWWRRGDTWPRKIAIHQDGGATKGGKKHLSHPHPVLSKITISNWLVQNLTNVDSLIEDMRDVTNTDLENNIIDQDNKKYFSPIFTSRTPSNKLINCFGVDVLGIVRNYFNNTKYFYNFNLSNLAQVMKSVHLHIRKAYIVDANKDKVLGSVLAKDMNISVPGGQTRTNWPFVKHYQIQDFATRWSRGAHYYSVEMRISFSSLVTRLKRDAKRLEKINKDINYVNNTLKLTKPDFDLADNDNLFRWSYASRIARELLKMQQEYSESPEPIVLLEGANNVAIIATLLKNGIGRNKVLQLVVELSRRINADISLLQNSTVKDQPGDGFVPSSPSATTNNRLETIITHKFKAISEIVNMREAPYRYGVNYLDNFSSENNLFTTEQIAQRFSEEHNRYFENLEFNNDVEAITSKKFHSSLSLNEQKFSYLSPYAYYFRMGNPRNPQVYNIFDDKISNLDGNDCLKYNTYLLQYAYEKSQESGKLKTTQPVYYKNAVLDARYGKEKSINKYNAGYIFRDFNNKLQHYFKITKNFEVLHAARKASIRIIKSLTENHDPDHPTSDAVPKTHEKSFMSMEETDPSFILLVMLTEEIFNSGRPYNGAERFHLKTLLDSATYEEFSSLPNQVKTLIKYYDYVEQQNVIKNDPEKNACDLQESLTSFSDYAKKIYTEFSRDKGIAIAGYVYTNFFNLKEIQTFEGYETNGNSVFMQRPIFKKLKSMKRLQEGRKGAPVFCRLINYTNLKFNIPESTNFPIYNENFYVYLAQGAPSGAGGTGGGGNNAGAGMGGGTGGSAGAGTGAGSSYSP